MEELGARGEWEEGDREGRQRKEVKRNKNDRTREKGKERKRSRGK